MEINRFKQKPFIGILRGIEPDIVAPLVETVCESGLETIEITMNTIGATDIIKQFIDQSEGKLMVGAGTVLNLDDLKRALDAGAGFVLSPVVIPEVVDYCVANNIPVFPGALTPDEIYKAWDAGATMVKVFPANVFGPVYFKDIKAPLNNIELLACGGVSTQNAEEYFNNGASAVSFGGSLFKKEYLLNREFDKIKQDIINILAIDFS